MSNEKKVLLPRGLSWEPCKCGLVRIIAESWSVYGGDIAWGCPKCILQRAEAAEKLLAEENSRSVNEKEAL